MTSDDIKQAIANMSEGNRKEFISKVTFMGYDIDKFCEAAAKALNVLQGVSDQFSKSMKAIEEYILQGESENEPTQKYEIVGLSKLSKRCKDCNFVATCEHKRMESLAYIEPSASARVPDSSIQLTAPRLQGNNFINIGIGADTIVSLEREEIKKKVSKAIYGNSFKI